MGDDAAIYLYRCDDCGHITALSRGGGNLDECCDLDFLRRMSRLVVNPSTIPGQWESMGPNLYRDTVKGPPAILWIQGRDAYGLYVDGKCVYEIPGDALERGATGFATLRTANALLACPMGRRPVDS